MENQPGHATVSESVGRDKITIGDTYGSILAIGEGAQVIHRTVERSLSEIELLDQEQAFARRQVAEAVKKYVNDLNLAAKQALDKENKGNPYKSLVEYDIDDAPLFYGRAEAKKILMEHMEASRLVVLHADSGSGKTSLLKASIMPELLAQEHVPLWLRPYETPVADEFRHQLLPQVPDISLLNNMSLHGLLTWVTELLGGKRLVLIIDQFEEVLDRQTLPHKTAFLKQLQRCLDSSTLRVYWVLALRAEYLSRLGSFLQDLPTPLAHQYWLPPLTADEARKVIVEPAKTRGVTYDLLVVERILKDLNREGVAPPQLQLVCASLFDSLDSNQRHIGPEMYAPGNAEHLLQEYLGRVIKRDLLPEQRQAGWLILQALVTSQGRRQRATRRQLQTVVASHNISDDLFRNLVRRLIKSRLVRPMEGREESTNPEYELTHDYLVGRIELTPQAVQRKKAHELLSGQMKSYREYGILLAKRELEIIEEQSRHLVPGVHDLGAIELDLLFRSAQEYGRPQKPWYDCAQRLGLTGPLAALWIESLRRQDPALTDNTVQLLIGLPGADTVPHLVALLEDGADGCGPGLLSAPTSIQRRALAALVQIDSPEAASYLQQLTPGGFHFVAAGYHEAAKAPIWLNAFWVADRPVTVDNWQAFVETGGYDEKQYWAGLEAGPSRERSVLTGWTVRSGEGEHPVRNITWPEARAYTRWLAKSTGLPVDLPYEAEWDRAAASDPNVAQSMASAGRAHCHPWQPGGGPRLAGCRVLLRLVPFKDRAQATMLPASA